MTLTQVTKYMPDGLRGLTSLSNMLVEAASACKVSVVRSPAWDSIGIKLDGQRFWLGIVFSKPETLRFATRCRIDAQAAARLGLGEVSEASWAPGGVRWTREVDLESEDVHFFARNKVSQIQWLESFLRDSLTAARSIAMADQTPIPDEPEGN